MENNSFVLFFKLEQMLLENNKTGIFVISVCKKIANTF